MSKTGAHELDPLMFVRGQLSARDQGVLGDGAGVRLPTIRRARAEAVLLGSGLHELLACVLYPGRLTGAGLSVGERLEILLAMAAGYHRYEPSSLYRGHRAYPSPRSLFAAEVFVTVGHLTWYFDAEGHRCVVVGEDAEADPPPPWQAADSHGGAVIVVAAHLGTLPPSYLDLRWSLLLCESGHAAGSLATVATMLGLEPRVRFGFDDEESCRRIGAKRGDGWLPVLEVEVGVGGTPPRAVVGESPPKEEVPGERDAVLAADRLGWLAAEQVRDWENLAPVEAPDLVGEGALRFPLRPGAPPSRPWRDVLFERSGGRAHYGFSASPETLPVNVLADALHAASGSAGSPVAPLSRTRTGVRLLLVIERVESLPDGLYQWCPDEGELALLRAGELMEQFEMAYPYPKTIMRLGTANVGFLFLLDLAAVHARHGARGLRASHVEMGAALQAIGFSNAAHGMFTRPLRSFAPDALARLVAAPGHLDVAYTAVMGKDRFVELTLDLRP
ncbi:hypothetical protein [Nonomuraea sp. NPDC052265]|uniref:hypothetical protein n=1 Tax=Nonomuraea sp. NPDC052265 TaxID=3364374 RepID=UPI0037C64CE2